MKWAVGQVDRSKLQILLSTQGRDSTADTYTPVPFGDALKLVGAVNVPPDASPGTEVTLEMEGLASAGGIQTHQDSGLFYFNYQADNGTQHTVWLENADSIAKKIALALHYNLGGVALNDFDADAGMDERVWTVLENYRSMQPTIVENQLQLVWSVDNNQIGTSSVSDPKIVWNAPLDDGQHQIQVALSVDGGVTAGSSVGSVVKLAQAATPTPVEPTAEPTEEAAEPEPTAARATNPQPEATAGAGGRATGSCPEPTAPKPAAPPPPAAGGNFAGQNMFDYGIQIDWTSKDRDVELSHVQGMGFRWIKVQVRWCDMESSKGAADLSGPEDILNRANARGVKVLFSVLCAPEYSRSNHQGEGPPDNMQDAADFFGGLAGRFCNTSLGAIEVWNEENLQREWNGAPLSAARYMDMLKAVYPAIKNACPSIVVVSGAPTPTGWNDGVVAIDDIQYLEQLVSKRIEGFFGRHWVASERLQCACAVQRHRPGLQSSRSILPVAVRKPAPELEFPLDHDRLSECDGTAWGQQQTNLGDGIWVAHSYRGFLRRRSLPSCRRGQFAYASRAVVRGSVSVGQAAGLGRGDDCLAARL